MVSSPSPSTPKREWIQEQDTLKKNLITEDDFSWTIPDLLSSSSSSSTSLRYVGGVDVSVSRDDPCLACATLVVIDLQRDLDVVYEAFDVVHLQVPYVPGFLAFREAPVLVKLLEDMKSKEHALFPQLLMVDGNGILHPRGFGLACHLGILTNLPTIGIGKNLHHVDGLTMSKVRELLEDGENCGKNSIELVGGSGQIWGVAMRSGPHSSKPIFVSVGHRISLNLCLEVVRLCCKFRVPEPVRQADIRSRRWLVTHGGITKT